MTSTFDYHSGKSLANKLISQELDPKGSHNKKTLSQNLTFDALEMAGSFTKKRTNTWFALALILKGTKKKGNEDK